MLSPTSAHQGFLLLLMFASDDSFSMVTQMSSSGCLTYELTVSSCQCCTRENVAFLVHASINKSWLAPRGRKRLQPAASTECSGCPMWGSRAMLAAAKPPLQTQHQASVVSRLPSPGDLRDIHLLWFLHWRKCWRKRASCSLGWAKGNT